MTNKTIIIAIIVVASIIILAGGAYGTYYFFIKEKPQEQNTLQTQTDSEGNIQEPERVTATQGEQEDEDSEEAEELEEESKDSTDDNATNTEDSEEEKDSDNDGLTDAEEAEYKTDPQKKDTDGDGYSDYIEVKSGFDPLKAPEEETKTDSSSTNESTQNTENNDTGTTQAYPDPQEKMYVFFMHHSTGEIYWNGGLEKALANHNYVGYAPWWDGETDPPDFYGEFSDNDKWNIIAKEEMPEGKTRDIVLFKSCFPSSNITSDDMLEDYKTYYKKLFEIYAAHPDILFVPMSTPPLLEANTTVDAAKRAQDFENWLVVNYVTDYKKYSQNNLTYNTKDYNIGGFKIPRGLFSIPKNKKISDAIAQNSTADTNLAPFQLHSLLADSNGYLAKEYQSDPLDDHPNDKSGEVVGEAMWKHLNKAIVETSMAE